MSFSLQQPDFVNLTKIFAAYPALTLGQSASVYQIANELKMAGYTEEGNSPSSALGTFRIEAQRITIRPGLLSFYTQGGATIRIGSNAVESITDESGAALSSVEIEPVLVSKLNEDVVLEERTPGVARSAQVNDGAPAYSIAVASFSSLCDSGLGDACNRLGSLYASGKGVPQDYAHAASLYSKACDAGLQDGCESLGNLYAIGQGVAQDYSRAKGIFSKDCDEPQGDSSGACSNLGVILQNGYGVAPDHSQAAALFKKACDAGDSPGCGDLAYLYTKGDGVNQDAALATALFTKACDSGDAKSCSNLGVFYRSGFGGNTDKDKAKLLFSRGCTLGNQWGCDRGKEMN